MGQKTSGTLRQKFKIRIDLEKLINFLSENIRVSDSSWIQDIDADEWEFEDCGVVISGTYESGYRSEYWRATMYEPEEYNIDRGYLGDERDIFCKIPKELRELIEVTDIEEDDSDAKVI